MRLITKAVLTAAVLQLGLLPAGHADETNDRAAVASAKHAAIQEMQNLLGQRLRREYPAASRVSVYLDAPIGRYVLEQVGLFVDGEQRATRNFTETEAWALLEGGAERLLRFNAAGGKHKLRIEFSGYLHTADGSKIDLQDAIELDFETKPGAQAFILPAAPKALRPITSIRAPNRENWNWRSETDDPRLDRVRFLRAQGKNFEALLELLEVAGVSDDASELPRGFHNLLALSYLDFGLRNQALRAARKAWEVDPVADALADAWLGIARLDYQHGEYAQASQILAETARLNLNPAQKLRWQDLQSRSLMAQGEYAQAAGVLQQASQALDTKTQNQEESLYLRYNHAIALIKSGRPQAGRSLLDRIGQDQIANPLRDQANLALAYHYLDSGKANIAEPIFQRLPLTGPYANRALLGLGWAQLAFDNAAQTRNALTAWNELAGRAGADPAALEARVARAYALEQLGQYTQAAHAYQQAIHDYAQTRSRLESLVSDLRQGKLAGSLATGDFSDLAAGELTGETYAGHSLQAHLKNARQLQQLRGALRSRNGSSAVQARLARSADAEIKHAQAQLASALEQQLTRLARYERAAQFGLLRSYGQR